MILELKNKITIVSVVRLLENVLDSDFFLIWVSLEKYNTQFLSVRLIYDWFWIARCHNGIQLNIKYADNEWNSIKTGSFIQYYNGWDCTKWILPIYTCNDLEIRIYYFLFQKYSKGSPIVFPTCTATTWASPVRSTWILAWRKRRGPVST